MAMTLTSCGKKESSPRATNPNPNQTTSTSSSTGARKIDLSRIQISDAQVREVGAGLSIVNGVYKGDLDAVIPCTLTRPLDLKKGLSGSLPVIELSDVVAGSGGITKGRIQTFEINRNNRPQAIIGLSLANNNGQVVVAQKANYTDGADQTQCTQMLAESYNVVTKDNAPTKRVLNLVTVLEGDTMIKTTTVVDDTRI